jgi:hypothetical protein
MRRRFDGPTMMNGNRKVAFATVTLLCLLATSMARADETLKYRLFTHATNVQTIDVGGCYSEHWRAAARAPRRPVKESLEREAHWPHVLFDKMPRLVRGFFGDRLVMALMVGTKVRFYERYRPQQVRWGALGVIVNVEERPASFGGQENWVRARFGDFI